MIRQTHTYVNLEISQAAFDEIEGLLKAAKYDHLLQDGKVMMEGIALIPPEQPQENDPEDPKCDVCGDTAEQHRTEKGYDHEFGGIAPTHRDLIGKLNQEFTPDGNEALLKLHRSDCSVHNEPASPAGPCDCTMLSDFRKDIQSTINRYSKENGSNTPDYILAQFLVDSLSAYDKAVTAREKWYGREPVPVPADQCPPSPDVVGRPFLTGI
jgi:hypothetical protein